MDRTFPAFSTLRQASKIKERLNERTASSLNAWVSVASARKPGLVLHSNDLGGFSYHYGDGAQAGASGRTWAGGQVGGGTEGYYPAAYVDSLEVDGNYEDLSRKASFTLVAHTQTQANELIKHFLEPGYTVFLQWGWNTDGGNTGLIKNLGGSVSTIASFTNPKTADVRRQNSSWEYDNYVGFITGGNVELDGNKWKINVQCFGFTELPTTLNVADSVYKDTEVITGGRGGEIFANTQVAANRDNGTGRFMMMFNELPSHKRTPFVKDKLFNDPYMKKRVNYINFDNAVYEGIANKSSFGVSKAFAGGWAAITKGALVGGGVGSVIPGLGTALGATVGGGIALAKQIWDNFKQSVTVLSGGTNGTSGQTGEAEIEHGIKLVHEERFIRFGALIRIINAIGAKGYKLKDGTIVSFEIDSKDVPISGFTRMFSTKKTHLFVPNPKTPLFSVIFALQNSTPQTDFSQDKDNTVSADGESVVFPKPTGLTYNVPHGGGAPPITRNANTWGYLDDLYVNFDFAMEIIKTKNLNIREALLQILNGMSSAAGSIWDFQLVDSAVSGGKVIKTRIEDFNLTPSNDYTAQSKFALSGPNCPFIDTSMDMDIPNEVANSVIGERNSDSAKINSSNVSQKGQAGTRIGDYILDEVESDKTNAGAGSSAPIDNTPPATLTEEEQAIEQAKNYEKFMEKVGIYPKVNITVKSLETITDFEQLTYVGALDDLAVFESFKLEDDKGKIDSSGIGPLIAIHFTFTVHGVSGLRLGDTFAIDGLPGSYSDNGFFQVIDVKHSISGMQWTTSIKGGWRPYRA